jgi:hypothetical protein
MKVNLSFRKDSVQKNHHPILIKFVRFLQSKLPIEETLDIFITSEKEGKMTTGGRHDDSTIFVLGGKRLIRDILRTLAHEWVHEYQMTILKREKGPNIGGINEDEANAIAGKLIKLFEIEYPYVLETMYE